jgi:hopanoid biosynthesis associated protein HpnK
MRGLIVTADDFGLAVPVNEAVERGHREGILTTASLMVAAPAAADAVARARRLPALRVGLHLVLVNGTSVLAPAQIPALVDAQGNFSRNVFAAGVNYFFTPGIRRQLEAEIRAQFEAFSRTGLALDHLNAQNHMHVHPTIFSIALRVGREYGLRSIRIPFEPFGPSWRARRTGLAARLSTAVFLAPWLALMRFRAREAGIAANDFVFGMNDSGHMTASAVRAFLNNLPKGVSEIYLHPATVRWSGASPAGADFTGEFAALIDPDVVRTANAPSIRRITFTELSMERAERAG